MTPQPEHAEALRNIIHLAAACFDPNTHRSTPRLSVNREHISTINHQEIKSEEIANALSDVGYYSVVRIQNVLAIARRMLNELTWGYPEPTTAKETIVRTDSGLLFEVVTDGTWFGVSVKEPGKRKFRSMSCQTRSFEAMIKYLVGIAPQDFKTNVIRNPPTVQASIKLEGSDEV